jgi:hypothetical protein
LPAANSDTGVDYLRQQYPCWQTFMELRGELDPQQIFVSEYWRGHLGIQPLAARSHSMVVPRGEASAGPATDRVQSG